MQEKLVYADQKNSLMQQLMQNPPISIDQVMNKETHTNNKTIECPWCKTIILLPEKGIFHKENVIFLHYPTTNAIQVKESKSKSDLGDVCYNFWKITDQFHFENIGVSHIVPHPTRSYRYLLCAVCDIGPVGIKFEDENQIFYISHDRVKYKIN